MAKSKSKHRATNEEPQILVPKEPDKIYIRRNFKNFSPVPYAWVFDFGYAGILKKLIET